MSPVIKILLTRLGKRIAKRVKERAVAAAVGTAATGIGVTAIVNPEVLELIPESLRGWAVLAVVLTLCASKIVAEVREAVREARNDR